MAEKKGFQIKRKDSEPESIHWPKRKQSAFIFKNKGALEVLKVLLHKYHWANNLYR